MTCATGGCNVSTLLGKEMTGGKPPAKKSVPKKPKSTKKTKPHKKIK